MFMIGFIVASFLWPLGYLFRDTIKFWLVNHKILKG
jgi:hypothetical protein